MNGPSHYISAEQLLDAGIDYPADSIERNAAVSLASVHAALALAAATTLRMAHEFYEIADDVQAWAEATDAKALDEDHTDDPAAVDHHLDHITGYALTTQPFDQNGGAV